MDAVEPSPGIVRLLLRLTDHFSQVVVRDIDQAAMDAAVKALCRPGAATVTKLRNVILPTRAVLMHAARRGLCAPPLFETPAGAGGASRTRWLTPEEFARLREAAPAHLRALVTFLVCTGARVSEALRLDWSDVDLIERRVVLRGVKAKHGQARDRVVEDLAPAAAAALAELLHRAGFPGDWKGEGVRRYLQPEDVTPHVLRHTFATWHYFLHKDPMRLMRDGDSSALRLVERYAKLAPARLAPAIRAVWHHSDTKPDAVD